MCPEAENYISPVPTALFFRKYKIPVIKILKRGKFFENSKARPKNCIHQWDALKQVLLRKPTNNSGHGTIYSSPGSYPICQTPKIFTNSGKNMTLHKQTYAHLCGCSLQFLTVPNELRPRKLVEIQSQIYLLLKDKYMR